MALRSPFALSSLPLVKKLTVSGIIGNTQGVSRASSPPMKPRKKIRHMELPFLTPELDVPAPPFTTGSSRSTWGSL